MCIFVDVCLCICGGFLVVVCGFAGVCGFACMCGFADVSVCGCVYLWMLVDEILWMCLCVFMDVNVRL